MKDKEYLLLSLLNTAMAFYCKYCVSLRVNLILYSSFNRLDLYIWLEKNLTK